MVIITEDIIRKALNESIDEFMINEGWGDGIKNFGSWAKNKFGGVWNGIKNAAAMYMDSRTNGQWNNQYGIYATGSGKTTEMYYLNKWFNYHLDEIKGIARRTSDPSYFSKTELNWERDSSNPSKQHSTQTIYKYEDIPTYVKNMITPQNFNSWIKGFIKNREALRAIDAYIEYCSKHINDINSAFKLLNIWSFTNSRVGQYYLNNKRNAQKTSQQKYQQVNNNKERRDWNNYFNARERSGAYNT